MPKMNVRYVYSNWEHFLRKSVSKLVTDFASQEKASSPRLSSKEVSEIFFMSSPIVRFTYFFRAANKYLLNRSSLGKVVSNHAYEAHRIGNFIIRAV